MLNVLDIFSLSIVNTVMLSSLKSLWLPFPSLSLSEKRLFRWSLISCSSFSTSSCTLTSFCIFTLRINWSAGMWTYCLSRNFPVAPGFLLLNMASTVVEIFETWLWLSCLHLPSQWNSYQLFALNSLVSFISVVLKLFLWLRGQGNIISCHVRTQRGATLCYTVARTGPLEIMYRKIKNAPAHPPLSFMFPASPLRCYSFVPLFLKPLGDPLQDSSLMWILKKEKLTCFCLWYNPMKDNFIIKQ